VGGQRGALVGNISPLALGPIAAPQAQHIYIYPGAIYILCRVEVSATKNMEHLSIDIYIYISMHMPVPPDDGSGGAPGRGLAGGTPGGLPPRPRPKGPHVTLQFLKRLSPPKIRNVTQLSKKVAHFVWCFCRARTTPIQKLSPGAISSHLYCCMHFYPRNVVGGFV
jgi:hypothetical protein